MLLRFLILAAIAFVGLSLASSAAIAEEPKTESSKPTIEQEQKSVAPQPTTSHRARLSTRDRWRGKPYLGSSDETLRSHSLDKALPPANSAFNGGTNLQILGR
jgi:hypothetical protein